MKQILLSLTLAAGVAAMTACSDNKSDAPAKPAAQTPPDSAPAAAVAEKAVTAVKDTAQQAVITAKDVTAQATTAVAEKAQQAGAVAAEVKEKVVQATAAATEKVQQATSTATDAAARVKAQVNDALAKAQQLMGQGKLQDAQDLLKTLADLKLTPEQQKAIEDLKAKIQQALTAAKALGGDALKAIPGLPKP